MKRGTMSFLSMTLFFLSGVISPIFAYPNMAYELFNSNEKVDSLGIVYYNDNAYDLYKVGEIYVVLNPSGDVVKDQDVIQKVIFTELISENAKEYKKIYDDVEGSLIALEKEIKGVKITQGAVGTLGVLNLGIAYVYEPSLLEFSKRSLEGDFDFDEALSLSGSLSSHVSSLMSPPSYYRANSIKEENQRLMEGLIKIRDNGDALIKLGNKFKNKKIPVVGGALAKKGDEYQSSMNLFNDNLKEVQRMSGELPKFSSDATSLASLSVSRIKSKQKEALGAHQEVSRELNLTNVYIDDLSIKGIIVPSAQTSLSSARVSLSDAQSEIDEGKYNSAISDVEDAKYQIDKAKSLASRKEERAKNEAEASISQLEAMISQIKEGLDTAVKTGVSNKYLYIAQSEISDIDARLNAAKSKFSNGYYIDAEEIAQESVDDTYDVVSMIDSSILDFELAFSGGDDGGFDDGGGDENVCGEL